MSSQNLPVIASNFSDDSDGDELFITQVPSQKLSNVDNINDRPILDFDIENLLNSSTDSAVGSVEEICPLSLINSILDVPSNPVNLVNIPSPKPNQPEVEQI